MTNESIIKRLFRRDGKINTAAIRQDRLDTEAFEYIMSQYPEYTTLRDKLLSIKNDTVCRCLTCGNIMSWPKYLAARHYCSSQCGNNSPHKIQATKTATQTDEVKRRRKQTCIERYGVTNPFESAIIQDKVKCSQNKLYGGNPSSNESVKEKRKQTFQERYGVVNPMQLDSVKEQAARTMLEKYGEGFKTTHSRNIKHQYILSLGIDCTVEESNNISIGNPYRPISKELIMAKLGKSEMTLDLVKQNYTHFYPVAHRYGLMKSKAVSSPARQICDWLDEMGVVYQTNNRKLISPQEIDIFIPSHNIGIEVNGYYWHDAFRTGDNAYHSRKTDKCSSIGIQLLHFWDFEIDNQPELVKSIILSKLGITNRIAARKCTIVEVSKEQQKEFFYNNHLSGYATSKICYGLLFGDKVVMMMSFSRYRFKRTDSWEIIRIASLHNTTVVGGASKLLKHFIRQHCPTSILSYADRRISTGNVYNQLGFKYIKTTIFGYVYYTPKTGIVSRQSMMKHKLVKYGYDNSKTESEIVRSIGYTKLCDAGHMLFELNINTLEDIMLVSKGDWVIKGIKGEFHKIFLMPHTNRFNHKEYQ